MFLQSDADISAPLKILVISINCGSGNGQLVSCQVIAVTFKTLRL